MMKNRFFDRADHGGAQAGAIGICGGVVAHVLSEEAKGCHLRLGLYESPLDSTTLMVTVADLRAAVK